ncbi:hypothetical protein [Haladaptatus halobius]|uniref:hypothetical protein n=1 Tax=Haladaptatus halobius TaxID=2884875 RepID=UPI001D09EF4F|nr:hypothetical protein [Haladaptatus halobius]
MPIIWEWIVPVLTALWIVFFLAGIYRIGFDNDYRVVTVLLTVTMSILAVVFLVIPHWMTANYTETMTSVVFAVLVGKIIDHRDDPGWNYRQTVLYALVALGIELLGMVLEVLFSVSLRRGLLLVAVIFWMAAGYSYFNTINGNRYPAGETETNRT